MEALGIEFVKIQAAAVTAAHETASQQIGTIVDKDE